VELYTYASLEEVIAFLANNAIDYSSVEEQKMSLEDAFIGLTGKY
jgi:ABC-2 type transport system ATP-binding protein